jgi:hypothetical protein
MTSRSGKCRSRARPPFGALFIGVLLALIVTTSASSAEAQVDLRWDAPAHCPQVDGVRKRMLELAGPAIGKAKRLRAEGTITQVGERYRLKLVLRDDKEARERTIDSDSCANLGGAAAVALALLLQIEPTDTTRSTDSARPIDSARSTDSRPTDTTRSTDSETTESTVDTRNDESERAWSVLLRIPVGALDLGPMPRPSVSAGAYAGLRYERFRFVVGGRLSFAQTVTSADFRGSGAKLARATFDLSACRGFRSAHFELSPCLIVSLEHLSARGFGEGVAPRTRRSL